MIFLGERAGLAAAGGLLAYAVVAGAIGVLQRATRRREERVQRWNAVFYGGEAAAASTAAAWWQPTTAQRAA